jgi:hypothetical protein
MFTRSFIPIQPEMKKYIMESIEKSMEKYKSPTEKYNYNQKHPIAKKELEISYTNTQVNTIQWNKYQKI